MAEVFLKGVAARLTLPPKSQVKNFGGTALEATTTNTMSEPTSRTRQMTRVWARKLPLALLLKATGRKFLPLVWRTIATQPPPHVDGLFPVTNPDTFEAMVKQLARKATPLSLSDAIEVAQGRRKLRRPAFLLCFDGGLREFHDIIAPILHHAGIPATCFLATPCMDNRDLYYRYEANLLGRQLAASEMHFLNPWVAGAFQSAGFDTKRPYEAMLSLGFSQRDSIHQLAQEIGLDFEAYRTNMRPYMTWEQVRSLVEKGFQFGAMLGDQPDLDRIDEAAWFAQATRSLQKVHDELGNQPAALALHTADAALPKRYFERLQQEQPGLTTWGVLGLRRDRVQGHQQRLMMEVPGFAPMPLLQAEIAAAWLRAVTGGQTVRRPR